MGGRRDLLIIISLFSPVVAELISRYVIVSFFYGAPHTNVHSHVIASFSLGMLISYSILVAAIAVAAALILGGDPVKAFYRSRRFVVFTVVWTLVVFFAVQAMAKWAEGVAALLIVTVVLAYATTVLVVPCSALTAVVEGRVCRSVKGIIIAGAAGITALFISLIVGGVAVRLLMISPELVYGNAIVMLANWSLPLVAAEVVQVLTYEICVLGVVWAAFKK